MNIILLYNCDAYTYIHVCIILEFFFLNCSSSGDANRWSTQSMRRDEVQSIPRFDIVIRIIFRVPLCVY